MPRRKPPSKKPFGQIRVLIVDDDELARKAWGKVLNNSKQIQVIGDIDPKELRRFKKTSQLPEVLVAGYSFVEAGFLKRRALQTVIGVRPKIILIVDNKSQIRTALMQRADFVTSKPFEPQDLITWVRALSEDAKRLCSEYRSQFSKVQSVPSQNEAYVELVSSTLQLLFHPDLIIPEETSRPANSSLVRRLVFRNQARDHRFWMEARNTHKSKYVTVDIHNENLGPDHLKTLGKYLSSSHGFMGLVIGRNFRSNNIQSISTALFENENKIVFPLNDLQLQTMLEYKAGGVNPVFELEQIYQQIIANSGN